MAILEHHPSGQRFELAVRTLVGRGTNCTLPIDDPGVSSEHAVIQFETDGWTVRDLNSTNGTQLGKQTLGTQPCPLTLSKKLHFGSAPGEWELVDDAPPAWLQPLPTGEALPLTRTPRNLSPEMLVRAYVKDRTILLERAQGVQELRDGEVIDIAGACFRVMAPVSTSTALTLWDLDQAVLWAQRAQDPDQFDVAFTVGGRRYAIKPNERNVLFHSLAKTRLEHRRQGITPEEEGWELRSKLARPGTSEAFRQNLDRCKRDVEKLRIFRQPASIFQDRSGHIRLRIIDVRVDAPRAELEAFPLGPSAATRPPRSAPRHRR